MYNLHQKTLVLPFVLIHAVGTAYSEGTCESKGSQSSDSNGLLQGRIKVDHERQETTQADIPISSAQLVTYTHSAAFKGYGATNEMDSGLGATRRALELSSTQPPAVWSALQRTKSTSTFTEVQTPSCASCRTAEAVRIHHNIGQHSSACCLSGGQTNWGTSHMFQVMGAEYTKGKLNVFGDREMETKTAKCYEECGVSWFEYHGDAGTNHSSARIAALLHVQELPWVQMLNINSKARPECEPGDWHEAALIVSRYFANNLYHNLIDTLFTAFLTASHISFDSGCTLGKVDVFLEDLGWSVGADNFDFLWSRMFEAPVRPTSTMNGCYRRVVYGSLYNQRFYHWSQGPPNRLYRSAVMMPWLMGYSQNLRTSVGQNSTFMLPTNSVPASSRFMLLHHHRWPSHLWNFSWEMLAGATVQREEMMVYPIKEQVQMMMAANGIISAEGAGFVHQLFLKPSSALLILTDLSSDDFPCTALPETWHDSVALHLGHTSLNWKVCNEDIDAWSSQTRQSKIQAIWNLLLARWGAAKKENKSSSCFVLKASPQNSAWPSCDKEVTMPVDGTKIAKCGVWSVGAPIRDSDDWFQDDLGLSEVDFKAQHTFKHAHIG